MVYTPTDGDPSKY